MLAWTDCTVTPVNTPVDLACHTSLVPGWVAVRRTRLQVSPAPETVAVCPPPRGPSDDTNATRSSPAWVVEKAAVVAVPFTFTETTRSTPSPAATAVVGVGTSNSTAASRGARTAIAANRPFVECR